MLKRLILRAFNKLGYQLVRLTPPGPESPMHAIPDASCYRPFFNPWLCDSEFNDVFSVVAPTTIVSVDRCYVLWTLALQAMHIPGEFFECGVYQGGTALLLTEAIALRSKSKRIHLFDTFTGMPETGSHDLHQRGDFANAALNQVRSFVGHPEIATFHPGFIPETFADQADACIAFAHIDVDIYQPILDCCEFIYPRLSLGGIMVFDDYGFPSCPGARKAVDEFFSNKPEQPLVLANGQAVVIRLYKDVTGRQEPVASITTQNRFPTEAE